MLGPDRAVGFHPDRDNQLLPVARSLRHRRICNGDDGDRTCGAAGGRQGLVDALTNGCKILSQRSATADGSAFMSIQTSTRISTLRSRHQSDLRRNRRSYGCPGPCAAWVRPAFDRSTTALWQSARDTRDSHAGGTMVKSSATVSCRQVSGLSACPGFRLMSTGGIQSRRLWWRRAGQDCPSPSAASCHTIALRHSG